MDNDFEFENLDELEDMFEEFEDFEDIEEQEIETRTAILSKNNMIALLCLKTAGQGGAICRIDPREDRPAVQLYDDAEKALEWFTKSLNTSRKNGWKIAYDGLPLKG
ncbi:MAG: hypothetical protein K1X72_17845 [Pyrinomonadaceae bacterium]|nr:hypothetical protein [Pyrinomonadaceae bacterium]